MTLFSWNDDFGQNSIAVTELWFDRMCRLLDALRNGDHGKVLKRFMKLYLTHVCLAIFYLPSTDETHKPARHRRTA